MRFQDRYDFKEYDLDVHKCIRCGYCTSICPLYDYSAWESESPRGRMQLIKRLNDRELDYNHLIRDRMYECTLCGYCKFKCPAKVRTVDAIKAARFQLVNRGLIPESLVSINAAVKETKNIFNHPAKSRTDWIDYMRMQDFVHTSRRADIVYFTGCTTPLTGRTMSIAAATASILNNLGYKWTLLGDKEWCCGNPLLSGGQIEEIRRIARHNIEAIRRTGAKTVVTSCPGCYRVFADEYSDIIGDVGLEVLHITQVIEEGIDDNRFEIKKRIDKRVTYHDPCELGRLMEVFEPPRKILENIPGLKFTELKRTRNFTYCCGAGGLMKATYSDLAKNMGVRKLKEAHEAEAEVIVSSCQTCKLNVMDAILEKHDQLKTVDITELLARAIGGKEMESPRANRFISFL